VCVLISLVQSTENQGGRPFPIGMDMRPYNETPGQMANAGELTSRFLNKDPIYFYLLAKETVSVCTSRPASCPSSFSCDSSMDQCPDKMSDAAHRTTPPALTWRGRCGHRPRW
jgi:hypothetical protein